MLKINGVDVSDPKVFKIDVLDLDGESNRNAKGDLVRDRVAVKRKLNCEWGPLKDAEISSLLKAVSSIYFTVEYPDPVEGKRIIKTFYVGDRGAPMYFVKNGAPLWQGLTMNLIEK
ncbi:DUF6711 family protein [Clostridium algidicarnis]|uniref:DUF6711 family protein n=1 Tax=Clostridium algidicarnis TaxID=37659 RepID=UPI0016233DD1|nr:DUF6711 family protein [Clostridium algidicarnis]MBB6696242.1 hypothetical protein [Clostridium algidicarnis]MBU3205567.1 hypothetical protein [Clostridium algidicarnis]